MSTKLNRFFCWVLLRLLLCLRHSHSIHAELHYLYCYYRYDAKFSVLSLIDANRLQQYAQRVGCNSAEYIAKAKYLFGQSEDN